MTMSNEFGRRLAEVREEAGVSQRRLAKALELDPSAVSRIEAGQRALTAGELVAAADYLGVGIESLARGRDEPFVAWADSEDDDVRGAVSTLRDVIEDFLMFEAAAR